MAVLSDSIEEFIKSMMDEYEGILELQRNEMAQYFSCAPSQINYVLATRFSPERGYIIESRRGGGGFIKVTRIDSANDRIEIIANIISNKLAQGSVSQREAASILHDLHAIGLISDRERDIMLGAVSDRAMAIPATINKNSAAVAFPIVKASVTLFCSI